ncbi:MAG: transposase [Verrucomicrobiae bacterium]|nr:transposase [Verrucomicrobiae bacterium]
MNQMNKLCMEMTFERRKPESKKQRKKILRRMKKLSRVVMRHARRHSELLDKEWEQTDWRRGQAQQVMRRIAGVMEKMPAAIKQAHERIIGERVVKNEDKLLSLYEEDTRVIVRGKAGAEVEFGNKLLLAEQRKGMILDWKLSLETEADPKMFKPCLERIRALLGKKRLKLAITDRGFQSQDNRKYLEEKKIYDGICPKNVIEMKDRFGEPKFKKGQKRRAQSEGRIGIFKNVFCGRPMRSKGFENRALSIAWKVLAHNLWVLARQPNKVDKLTKIELKIAA